MGFIKAKKNDALDFNSAPANGGDSNYHANAKPGDLKYVDVSGDNTITVEDKTYLGDQFQILTGLTLGFNFRTHFNFAFLLLGMISRDYERKNFSNKGSHVIDSWTQIIQVIPT